jgi:cystathionine beta-lyase/cystathionine gamma-synthase
MTDPAPHLDTTAIRAGRGANGSALAPVLWASSAFVTPDSATAHRMATTTRATEFYSRYGNPTVCAFESAMAEMEGGEAARAFSSGMGAISAIVLGLVSSGDHIVTQRQLYGGTQVLFNAVCPRFNIDVTYVDGTDPDAWDAAIIPGRTMLCFAETPANPRLALVDLARFGAIAGPITVVDSTFATPIGQRPLEYGVNLVRALGDQVHRRSQRRDHRRRGGRARVDRLAVGLRRAARRQRVALRRDERHPRASARCRCATSGSRGRRSGSPSSSRLIRPSASVSFPGLASHPQYELARRQLSAPGGLITFDIVGGSVAGRVFVESTTIAQMATSLGGPETLVTHPSTTTHVGLLPEELVDAGITEGTVRMSVGLEHPDDLIADIGAALDAAAAASSSA